MLNPYFLTAFPSTSVSHSKKGVFTGPNDVNLIICKTSRLEIFVLTETGIKLVRQENLFARIVFMELFRPESSQVDFLFLCSERFQYAVLSWNQTNETLVLEKQGNFQEREAQPYLQGPFGFLDPKGSIVALSLYKGWLTIIPFDIASFASFRNDTLNNSKSVEVKLKNNKNKNNKEHYTLSLQELNPLSIVADAIEPSTFAILFLDNDSTCHVRTYKICPEGLVEGPLKSTVVHPKSHSLIPFPHGGFIVFSEVSAQYIGNFGNPPIHMFSKPHYLKCWSPIDPDYSRILIGEMHGSYSVLFITYNESGIRNMELRYIGLGTTCTTLTYLVNGFAFLGSHFGDSSLIRLLEKPDPSGSAIQLISNYANIGPLVDFILMERRGQPGAGQFITCSGAFNDASLRVLRYGIELKQIQFLEVPSLTKVFSIGYSKKKDDHLVALATSTSTFFLSTFSFSKSGASSSSFQETGSSQELVQVDLPLISNQPTLLFTLSADAYLIQVTPSGIFIYDSHTFHQITEWTVPSASSIIDACFVSPFFLVASGCTLYCLNFTSGLHLSLMQTKTWDHDISSIDFNLESNLCAVGLWNAEVYLLSLPSLEILDVSKLGDLCARSIRICHWANHFHLICGFGNGNVISFNILISQGQLIDPTELNFGTQPIQFSRFRRNNEILLFGCSNQPIVLSGSSTGQLLYSNINLKDVEDVCSFRNRLLGDEVLLAATKRGLVVCLIDDTDTFHIDTYPLRGEMGRKIAHHAPTQTMVVLTERVEERENHSQVFTGFVKLFDDLTLELLTVYPLHKRETPQSICIYTNPNGYSRVIVGTAFELPHESEPKSGRILLFSIEHRKLKLLHELSTMGSVYSLAMVSDHIVAGINYCIQMYALENDALLPKCSNHGNITILYLETLGNYIAAGDIMKSVSLWTYQATQDRLELVARDPSPHWITAIAMLDEDHILASDSSLNVFIVKRPDSTHEHPPASNRMEMVAEFHTNEFMNRFIPNYLHPVKDCLVTPLFTSASINGHIGIFGHVQTKEDFDVLLALQKAVALKTILFFNYDQYRSFQNERKKVHAHGIIDGDMVERFLDLNEETKLEIAKQLSIHFKSEISVNTLMRKVNDIARLH